MRLKLKMKCPQDVILGLDASLTHTGVVLLDGKDKMRLVTTLTCKNRKVARLKSINDQFRRILEVHRPRLYAVVMEGYAFANPKFGFSPAHSIGELGGVLKLSVVEYGLPIYVVAPLSLKKFATGSGKGDKNKVMLKVYRKYGIELADDHQTDAFVLAQIGQMIRHYTQKQTWPNDIAQYEKEVALTVIKGANNVTATGD